MKEVGDPLVEETISRIGAEYATPIEKTEVLESTTAAGDDGIPPRAPALREHPKYQALLAGAGN